MDYMNMDYQSIGMFWVVSYTMAQPVCEAVINWLSSAGVELLPGSNMQSSDRVMKEVSLLPMSLISGFSKHLCLKLALQMEDSLFVNPVRTFPCKSISDYSSDLFCFCLFILYYCLPP